MKIRKIPTFRAKADVVKIDCGVLNADVNVISTDSPNLYIEYTKNFAPHFAEGDGIVTIRQLKSRFWKIKHPVVNIYVPDCCVPHLKIDAIKSNVTINGGIFNDAEISGRTIKAEICGATFENLDIKADSLDVSADNITVKNLANAFAADGRVELDKTFCKHAECRVKKGNIGLSCSTCDYAVLNAEEGNIAANMLGDESDYSIELQGAAVSRKELSPGAKSIRARAVKGNVVLDFEKSPLATDRHEIEEREELHA